MLMRTYTLQARRRARTPTRARTKALNRVRKVVDRCCDVKHVLWNENPLSLTFFFEIPSYYATKNTTSKNETKKFEANRRCSEVILLELVVILHIDSDNCIAVRRKSSFEICSDTRREFGHALSATDCVEQLHSEFDCFTLPYSHLPISLLLTSSKVQFAHCIRL